MCWLGLFSARVCGARLLCYSLGKLVFHHGFVFTWLFSTARFLEDVLLALFACDRSTGPPGGNQVDGLPPALRFCKTNWKLNILREMAASKPLKLVNS